MATVRDLIKSSLRQIGAIDPGENVEAGEAADALATLNQMLESWSLENLLVHATVREEFSFVSGQASYTMGTGGNFNTTRPIKIEKANIEFQTSPSHESELEIINESQWASIANKDLSGTPSHLYVMGTYPLETLKVWPVPAGEKIAIYSAKSIASFASVSDDVELPPGYFDALKFNLAVRLAPEYGKSPSEVTVALAQSSVKALKKSNAKPVIMQTDAPTEARFNITTGE